MNNHQATKLSTLLATLCIGTAGISSAQSKLPDPDGRPADLSKPVQVFILMGQSNMLGFGKIKGGEGSLENAVKEKELYPYLIDDGGSWTERKDVRNVRVMGSGDGAMKLFNNEWRQSRAARSVPRSGPGITWDRPYLIKQLRKEFDAPDAKFVCASLGQTEEGASDGDGQILDAMLAIDGESGKHPEFKGNVAAVYTHPLSKGGSSGGHYSGNAETYMNVGEAMGEAMVNLLANH
jgi:hypothetical protein